LDFLHESSSREEFNKDIYIIPTYVLDWYYNKIKKNVVIYINDSFRFASNALRNDADKTNPRASVLRHKSFDSLPTCLFIVAELDPLRDDSYSKRESKIKIE
jgi:acetyl esterase/lipase